MTPAGEDRENYYTLLGVREDGVASVVDVVFAELSIVRDKGRALLLEHASCVNVEIWLDQSLVERLSRA